MATHGGSEKFVPDLAGRMQPDKPGTLAFSVATYQVYDEEAPTAVLAYGASDLGLIVWNLLPGQENEFHLHPASEHLQIVTEGEIEFTLGDEPPRILTVGDAVMVPANVPHGIRNVSDQPASYLAAAVSKSGSYEKVVVERPA